MMPQQRLSNLDAMMLRMDSPDDPAVITGMLILGAPLDMEQLKATIETRLLRFERFRQRVIPSRLPWRTPSWQDHPDVDLDYHVQRIALPSPGDQAALERTVSDLAGISLDMTRPPWQMHLIESYGPGCALVCRMHHSLADGVALIHVLLSLADTEVGDSPTDPMQSPTPAGADAGRRSPDQSRRRPVRRLVRGGLHTLGQLKRGPELARKAREAAAVVSDLVLSPSDADTALRGIPSMPKSVAWSGPIPLEEIKTIGRRLGGTVNDVLLAALAGGLVRYLESRQNLPDDASLHAIIPINRRPPGAEIELGNRITAAFLPLPTDIANPVERLAQLKRRMDGIKSSLQPTVMLAALEIVSRVPSTAFTLAMDYMSSKATVIVTNVKGPQAPLTLIGAPIAELMAWIPRYGGIGAGISILSYAGQVQLGIISDKSIVPDPENIIAAFRDEVATLLALAHEPQRSTSMKELSGRLDAALATFNELIPDNAAEDGDI